MIIDTAPESKTQSVAIPSIVFDPADNYRWGSQEAMERDVETSFVEGDSGRKVNSFRTIVDSIKSTGHVQVPIGVRPDGKRFRVVYGFNRYLAAKEVGLKTIPAVVYAADTDEATLATLQVVENSDSLKRTVNWVAETNMWEKLLGLTIAKYENILPSRRPKSRTGHPLSPAACAWAEMSAKLGRSMLTMRERIQILRCLAPEVQEAAHHKNWSFNAAKEFYSGDARQPYPHDFVLTVLAEIRRSDPDLTNVTPATVVKAKTRCAKWIAEGRGKDGAPIWRNPDGKEAAPINVNEGSLRLSPASMRDAAINLAADMLRTQKVTLSSADDERWASLTRTATWHRVTGIGIGTGYVRLKDASDDLAGNADFIDLAARADFFVCGVFVTAALRVEIETRCKVSWSDWYLGTTVTSSESRNNRTLFRSCAAAGTEYNGSLREKVKAAWDALDESGFMPQVRQ